MNGRSVAFQGALAAVALMIAYVTWQREPELSTGEVIVLDATKNDLEKVRFDDTEFKAWAELSRGNDATGPFAWVRMSGTDISNVPMPSGHPYIPIKVPERMVRGNDTALFTLERFAPLRAARGLGVLDAAKLKDLGLDTTKKFLEITARGQKRRFAIVPAPPGGNDPYIRDERDGRVYLINRQLLTDLQGAQNNLVDRRMHAFNLEDADKLVVTAGAKKREFLATRVDPRYPGLKFAPPDAPDKAEQTVKNWHDKVWALFPAEVLGQGEKPTGGNPVVAVRLDYSSRGRPLGFVELAKAGNEPAALQAVSETPTPQPVSNDIFARSEHTAGWMKLPGDASGLVSEADGMVTRK